MSANPQAQLILDARAELGEGPIWDVDAKVLWWVDIEGGILHRYDPATNTDIPFEIGQRIGTVVPRAKGGVMLALEQGFAAFDPDTRQLDLINDPESHLPGNRFNDGKCDPSGRFWAGTMDLNKERRPVGALYSLDADGNVKKHFGDVRVSNGIVWTSDASTMYYIDSPTNRVDAFDYDETSGELGNRRTVVEVPSDIGKPDGMAIDADDNIWVSLWGGWAVVQFDPRSGELLSKIEVPVAQVTACAFGGPELDQLYITTAWTGQSDEALADQPHAGSLFGIRVGARGVPSVPYAG